MQESSKNIEQVSARFYISMLIVDVVLFKDVGNSSKVGGACISEGHF